MKGPITFALLCAITIAGTSKAAPPPSQSRPAAMGEMCPMRVPGTHVSAEDTPDGVAIVFKTSGDVAQLRAKVHAMAAKHDQMASGAMPGCCAGLMAVPSTVRAEDVDGGARMVLTPRDPAQLAALRDHVHERAAMMASGQCPMMQHGA